MSKIITISSEFGSGGRKIGKRLADELMKKINRYIRTDCRSTICFQENE